MKVLTCVSFCFLVFSVLVCEVFAVPVQDGDSLSKILLQNNGCDEKQMLEVMVALKDLQDTEEGVEKLKSFGIRSGNIERIYPGDKIKIDAIQEWFDSGTLDVSLDTQPDLIVFIEDEKVIGTEEDPLYDNESEDSEVEAPDTDSVSEVEPLKDAPEQIIPEEIILEEDAPSSEDLVQQIQEIAQDSRSRELGLGFNASYMLGYSNHGVDTVVLEQFFHGHIVSQEISISHSAGFRFAITNLTSVAGGAFSDLGDRTNLSIGLQKGFGSFYSVLQHQWVHTNYRMNESFFYADRHRTSFQSGVSLGAIQPYAFILSDIPAYTPVDEMMVYGGGGILLTLPIDSLNTEITIGGSLTSSLFWYYRSPRRLCRLRAGFVTRIGNISVNPEISYLTDIFTGNEIWVTSFKIAF